MTYGDRLARVLNHHEDKERGTGRTTKQLENLQNGSVFVVTSKSVADVITRYISVMDKPPKNVELIVCRNLQELQMRSKGIQRPIVIDHYAQLMMAQQAISDIGWIEEKHKRGRV